MLKFPLKICWHLPYKELFLLAFHEMGVPQSLLDVLIPLYTFSVV
jgi:hypothetical protein